MSSLYVIAGPNGAGKTTFIKRFAPREIAILDFLNADEVARGLSPFDPTRAQFEAGRIVLQRFEQFVQQKRDFCLETTLSGKTYARHFRRAKEAGYHIRLDYLMLPSVEDSIQRVGDRVEQGGHNVPLQDLHRRFEVSLRNLFAIYRPVVDRWALYNNGEHTPVLLAYGGTEEMTVVAKEAFEKTVSYFNLKI